MAYLITTKGEFKEVYDLDLEKMQKLVGGYIQIVNSYDGKHSFVCDEDGKFKEYPINETATRYGHECGALAYDDYFVGDVLMGASSEFD